MTHKAPIADIAAFGELADMIVTRRMFGQFGSWLLFATAILVSAVISLELMLASGSELISAPIQGRPGAIALVVLMIFNPLIFGLTGLVNTSIRRRTICAVALLSVMGVYLLLAFGLMPSFAYRALG